MDENAIDQSIYFIDNDGDGVGGTTFQLACSAPQGYVDIPGDCDDNNGSVKPNVYGGVQWNDDKLQW